MKLGVRSLFVLCFTVVSLTILPGISRADSPASPRSETEVKRITVKLSDVFSGVPDEIDRDIAQAPAPCKRVVYDVNVLVRLAKKYRLDWSPQSLADHVVITSACTRITSDSIRDAVVNKLHAEGVKGEIDISFDNHTLEVDLPADQPADFNFNNFSWDQSNKRFSTDLVTESSSGLFSIPVTGRIVVKESVPVLLHRLEGGTVISATDIDWINVPEERVNASVILDAKHLIGRELRRDTESQALLHTNDLIPPRHVTRGSLITLKIETPFMILTAQGKALQDGTDGDVVRVINTQSNRVIEGIVEGPGVVRIHIAQKIAAIE